MHDPVLDDKSLAFPRINPTRDGQIGAQLARIPVGRAGLKERHAVDPELFTQFGIRKTVRAEQPLRALIEPDVKGRVKDNSCEIAMRPFDLYLTDKFFHVAPGGF
jgi:hypothetical protein